MSAHLAPARTASHKDLVAYVTDALMGRGDLALTLTAVSVPRNAGVSGGFTALVADGAGGDAAFVAFWDSEKRKWTIKSRDFGERDLVEVAAADPRTALKAWMADVNAHVADVEGESA